MVGGLFSRVWLKGGGGDFHLIGSLVRAVETSFTMCVLVFSFSWRHLACRNCLTDEPDLLDMIF